MRSFPSLPAPFHHCVSRMKLCSFTQHKFQFHNVYLFLMWSMMLHINPNASFICYLSLLVLFLPLWLFFASFNYTQLKAPWNILKKVISQQVRRWLSQDWLDTSEWWLIMVPTVDTFALTIKYQTFYTLAFPCGDFKLYILVWSASSTTITLFWPESHFIDVY